MAASDNIELPNDVVLLMILGAIVGSKVAITKGASYVRPLYLIVTTLLVGKQVYELLFK